MNTEQLDRIEEMLVELLAFQHTRKPGRKPGIAPQGTNIIRERVECLETLFWKIVNSPRGKKKEAYRVPACLLGDRDAPNIEAVVMSVLLNQASLRKVFRTAAPGDSSRESPLDRARRAVEASNLVLLPMGRLRIGATMSDTMVAISPGEARRQARVTVDLPESKGWTTPERAEGFEGMTGYVEAPEDPCGARAWPGDDAPVEAPEAVPVVPVPAPARSMFDKQAFAALASDDEVPVEPRKHPLVVFSLGNQKVAEIEK